MKPQQIRWNLVAAITALITLASVTPTLGSVTLFSDNFKGPQLNPLWVTNLPTAPVAKGDSTPETYLGVPDYEFATLGGATVLHMTNTLSPLQRVGWSLNANFNPSSFRYEVRFNTLTQSPDTSIDAFIEIWVLDVDDFNRYDIVSPFGASSSTDPRFDAASSVTGSTTDQSFAYQNNTWYRLVLHGSTNEDIRASLCDDEGNELIGYDLGHNTTVYPSGFTIGLSQAINRPYNASPTDVAVDSAIVTSGDTTIQSVTTPAVQVSWPSVAGKFYQVQSTSLNKGGKWANLGSPLLGTGSTMNIFEPETIFKR